MKHSYSVSLKKTINKNELEVVNNQDLEGKLLYLRKPVQNQLANTINFNGGQLLIGFDEHQELRDIEIGIPMEGWTNLQDLSRPCPKHRATIEILEAKSNHVEVELPISVYQNRENFLILIHENYYNMQGEWIEISPCLYIMLYLNEIRGIFVIKS